MKRYAKLIIALGVVVVVGVVTTIVYATSEQSKDNTPADTLSLRYAAPLTIAAAPVYVADSKGLWAEQGLDVEVTYFDSGRKALDALLAEDAEVMSVSETPPLRAYLGGAEIEIVTTVAEHREAKMTVHKGVVKTASDVVGKRIGTVSGTNSDYYMYRWLEEHEITEDQVEIIQLDAAALAQAFVQGDIDVMFAWEPYNFNAVSKNPDLAESWPTEIYQGRHTVVMNSAYAANHNEAVSRLIRGFIAAQEFIETHPEEAKRIVVDRTGISAEALDGLWDEYTYKVQLDDALLSIVEDEADWIQPGSVDGVKSIVNPEFMLAVDTARVSGGYAR